MVLQRRHFVRHRFYQSKPKLLKRLKLVKMLLAQSRQMRNKYFAPNEATRFSQNFWNRMLLIAWKMAWMLSKHGLCSSLLWLFLASFDLIFVLLTYVEQTEVNFAEKQKTIAKTQTFLKVSNARHRMAMWVFVNVVDSFCFKGLSRSWITITLT